MAESKQYYIGVDVGGTSVKLGLFDEEGDLLGKTSVPTPSLACGEGHAAVISGIETAYGWRAAAHAVRARYRLGSALSGARKRCDHHGGQHRDRRPALKEALEVRCPHALVRYVNDANAAAMGEVWRGSAQGHRSMVMVTIGTGLGGGVVVNGDVIDGAFGAGGEIGHICVNPAEERACGCGLHGCLEQYASASGVVNNYLRVCEERGVEPVELVGPSDSRSVFDAARAGDETALAAIDATMDYLSLGLQIISAVVDPEVYVLGGGASASRPICSWIPCARSTRPARSPRVAPRRSKSPRSATTPASSERHTWRCAPPLARCRLSAAVVLPLRLRAAGGYERFSCHAWSL
ncbi:MAG: ROK family protein [Collinsella sp.]